MTVAIVGSRSWLSPHFTAELVRRGHTVENVAKGDVPYENFRRFSAVILIAGRARPTAEDILLEERLVADACQNPHQPSRWVYVSSGAVDRWERGSRPLSRRGEEYVLAKKRCETVVLGQPTGSRKAQGYAVRLPVIFGPGQDIRSDMLVPSTAMARISHGILELQQPLLPFELVHVEDAARATADLIEAHDPLPILSVRSDLHQPLRLVSVMAPGIQTILREGWSWNELGHPEKGQRHLSEVHYKLKDSDLIRTMEWYEESSTALLEGAAARRRLQHGLAVEDVLSLPPGKDIIDL